MTDDQTPPTPLPAASQPPYPAHPAPHPQRDEALAAAAHAPKAEPHTGPAIGALGVTLIGGAVAAAVGLLVAIPFIRRKPKATPKPTPRARRPRRKAD